MNEAAVDRIIATLPAVRRRGDTGMMIPESAVRRLVETLVVSAEALDALWSEPDPDSEDARDGLIWLSDDEVAIATALRDLRKALGAAYAGSDATRVEWFRDRLRTGQR